MRILVTAGGTREPIDAVRVIANTSTGRLGSRLADAAARAGHEVVLLHAAQAARPTVAVERHAFETSADLARLLEVHVPRCDAVVHAAAVSDFVPERTGGKIPSDADELVLRLRRAPKLVDRLRALRPDGCLVGFKLTAEPSEEARLAAGRRLLERARLDLVVVNDVARIGPDDHEAVLLGAAGVVDRVRGKAQLAERIVAHIAGHVGRAVSAP